MIFLKYISQSLLFLLALLGVGCASAPSGAPNTPEAQTAIEKAIRRTLNKPSGDLATADLAKVKGLYLGGNHISDLSTLAALKNVEGLSLPYNQITDLTPLAGLSQLKRLWIEDNPDLSRGQIRRLQRALPDCVIIHNATR